MSLPATPSRSATSPARHLSAIIVMGVSGSGKTTIGKMIASRLGMAFRDADDFHPAANIAKMSAGIPLTDEDRWPWLAAIAAWIDGFRKSQACCVVTCSALKHAYRTALKDGYEDVLIVYLKGDIATIGARMAKRKHHFMPTALLKSQFATLEEPGPDEHPLIAPIEGTPTAIVTHIVERLRAEATLL